MKLPSRVVTGRNRFIPRRAEPPGPAGGPGSIRSPSRGLCPSPRLVGMGGGGSDRLGIIRPRGQLSAGGGEGVFCRAPASADASGAAQGRDGRGRETDRGREDRREGRDRRGYETDGDRGSEGGREDGRKRGEQEGDRQTDRQGDRQTDR